MTTLHCRYGEFSVPDQNDLIFNALREYGEWAQEELDMLSRFVRPGDTVLDIGAFIGTHARAFSQMVGAQGIVHAFEPNERIYRELFKNAQLAPYSNIKTYQVALGARKQTQFLLQGDLLGNLGASQVLEDDRDASTTVIEQESLENLGLPRIDFIKIDVESMEYDVVVGGIRAIRQHAPVIFLEANSLQAAGRIIDLAHGMDYVVFGHVSRAFNPENFNRSTTNMFGEARECGLLLIHRNHLGTWQETLSTLQLHTIKTIDDLALLLLHKPQYIHEVLGGTKMLDNIASLNQAVAERNGQIASYSQAVTERDGQIASLSQAVTERDGQIASLSQAVTERDGQIASLSQAVTEREAAFMSIINSRSWRLTKPYRWVGRMLRGDIAGAAAPFKKLLSMKKDGQSPAAAASADIVVPDPIAPTHTVSVILPVYRGIDMTRRCIEAAMPAVLGMKDAVLLAINDASPEQGMQAMLESLVEIWPGRFEVLENPVNLGFVGTVNRGMAHLLSQDVVLLNSDVIVPDDWLRRLQVEAYSHPRIATVTPFSNNATVCSFPNFLEENPLAFNLDVHTIDAVFRLSHLPCVSAPTGIGFCMYIRRACLDQIGYLNSEKFGRGYGEENDLCQRAIKAGWLNILSPNMYVFHEGGVSFSTDKQALIDRAMGVLDSLHPNYHADVQAFIQRDPLRLARVERYLQLLAKLTLPKVLHVSHGLGGGVGQHIEELAGYFDQGAAHLVLAPQDGPNVVSLSLRACKLTDKLLFKMPDDYARLRNLLEQVGICAVHYHHTYNLDPVLQNLSRELHAITLLTAHDYFWLNANPTLTDVDGRFPGQYVNDLQNPLYPLPTGVTAAQWREKLRPLIEQADCVIFPSNATRALFGEMYRFKHEVVAPHVEPYLDVRQAPRPLVVKQHYVVGVLGALGREKGADVLEKLATMALSERARFSFKLIGYSYRQLSAVETTGPYKVENLMALIEQHEVDLILFPAQWPETYSYTLSHALASGLPIIAPNLGAFPERLSGRACATLFDHMEPVSELYRRIGDFIGALESGTVCAPVFPGDKSQPEFYDRDYLPLLASALKPPGSGKLSFEFGESQIVRGPLNKTGWRSAALRGLWWLHTHPSLRWVSSAVPYNFKRTVKRSLSRSPMHDSTI
ncbi:FkbM family methyltransferase [Acidovorax temperans]|uniref:FkbM family methyltransferase n=1 Tax=Acidovorax temperans TaxID=80878 RepID=UPI001A943A0E|nr:FkbM family methyltransferase [Acidovorax temperans]MBO0940365.1 FkbM family methyltransferase [Acidovorax temperans]